MHGDCCKYYIKMGIGNGFIGSALSGTHQGSEFLGYSHISATNFMNDINAFSSIIDLWGSSTWCLHSFPPVHPQNEISPRNVDENTSKVGVRECPPGLPPPLGERGGLPLTVRRD